VVTTGDGGKIRVLPGDVVSRIAAGEVVERPAAVVKELIDNSLDAGSRSITIDVQDGGLSLIRVSDDGEGMSREDAPRAFERHATSKLRSDRDLWSIRTMGFRGEALPSIASVSRVRVATAVKSATVGTEFEVQAGVIGTLLDSPPVIGTKIEVADLFYNQPARKKFLKSIPTEFAHISRALQQAALAWPGVHFRLTHNGQEVLNYPAVSSDRDRVGQVFPRAFLDHSRAVHGALSNVTLRGWTIDPVHARSARIPQELYVNRRPVRHNALFHAIAEGYGSTLPKGHHPLFVLFLDLNPELVDVNVHPTKREVRFAETETIHQLVRRAVRQAVGGTDTAGRPPGTAWGGSDRPGERTSATYGREPAPAVAVQAAGGELPMTATGLREAAGQLVFVSEAAEPYVAVPSMEVVALGQLNRTFLVAQIGGDLTVIDQHTAHERVLFERLVRAWGGRTMVSQPLLIPEPIDVSPAHATLLQRYREDLLQVGLDVEQFGPSTVLLRAVPAGIGTIHAATLIPDLLDDLSQWQTAASLEARVRPVLASVACHGAVRSGRSMTLPEIKTLIEDWLAAGAVTTCPHGRRTSFRLSTDDLEKMFGRAGW